MSRPVCGRRFRLALALVFGADAYPARRAKLAAPAKNLTMSSDDSTGSANALADKNTAASARSEVATRITMFPICSGPSSMPRVPQSKSAAIGCQQMPEAGDLHEPGRSRSPMPVSGTAIRRSAFDAGRACPAGSFPDTMFGTTDGGRSECMKTSAVFPDLRDASVLITGGGSGIGAALTEGFARQGARVAFIDIAEGAEHCACRPHRKGARHASAVPQGRHPRHRGAARCVSRGGRSAWRHHGAGQQRRARRPPRDRGRDGRVLGQQPGGQSASAFLHRAGGGARHEAGRATARSSISPRPRS